MNFLTGWEGGENLTGRAEGMKLQESLHVLKRSSYLPVGWACYSSKSRRVRKYFCSSLSQCQREFREPHVIADSQAKLG